jgi:hypothetical protein
LSTHLRLGLPSGLLPSGAVACIIKEFGTQHSQPLLGNDSTNRPIIT